MITKCIAVLALLPVLVTACCGQSFQLNFQVRDEFGKPIPGARVGLAAFERWKPGEAFGEARIEAIEARGGDSFREYSLPEAILKFRQGVGRLIRTKNDRGIIVALDNRILTKQYGKAFIDALPKCPVEIMA